MSSTVPGPHPEYHIAFGCHINLSISWLWQFLRFSLFCMNFTVLRCTGQILFSMPLGWNLKFLRLNCGCGIWGGKAHKMPLSSHQTRGTHHQHDLPLLILTLITCLSSFSMVVIFLCLSFHTVHFRSNHAQPQEWGVMLFLLGGNLHKLFGILHRSSVLPHLFNNLYQYDWLLWSSDISSSRWYFFVWALPYILVL